jgi:N-methylhydantoinase B
MINNVNGSLKDLPIEMLETRYPFRINEYSIRPNSGGPGQYRGGNGVVREYEFLADCVVGLWFERSKTPAWGLFGGSDAQGPEVVINPGRRDEVRTLKANARKVKAGDVVRLAVGGGGGFGEVSKRSREDITYDIVNGFITEDFAKTHYGY